MSQQSTLIIRSFRILKSRRQIHNHTPSKLKLNHGPSTENERYSILMCDLISKIRHEVTKIISTHILQESIYFDGKLRQDGDHQHDSQNSWSDGIFIRTRILVSNHRCSPRILIHTVADKGNGNWQQHDTIELRPRVRICECNNGHGRSCQQDGRVQPRQKGTLVGEKHLWLYFDGDLSFSRQGSDITVETTAVGSRGAAKYLLPETWFGCLSHGTKRGWRLRESRMQQRVGQTFLIEEKEISTLPRYETYFLTDGATGEVFAC